VQEHYITSTMSYLEYGQKFKITIYI
jgi:hypothetical protein